MAKCKNCGKEIDNSSSVCPTCGQINPIKNKKVRTLDITTQLDHDMKVIENYKPKRRIVAAILFWFLGFSGAPYFYLENKVKALMSIFSSVLIIVSALLLGVFIGNDVFVPLLIAIGMVYLVNIIVGLYYLTHHELKDGKGEFLI